MKIESEVRRTLPAMICPICGDELVARQGKAVAATNWLDCLRRCLQCEVGFSNAWNNPTILFNDPRLNVPPEVRDRVLDTLALSLNERNRPNKRAKFGFSTSEDAPRTSLTAQGISGDPLNIGLIGSEKSLIQVMLASGWKPADPITLKSSDRIASSVLLNGLYTEALPLNLLLGKSQLSSHPSV